MKYNTETFIEKATQLYGGKYTYEQTKYGGSHNFVIITCNTHGAFTIKAYSFLQGHSCRACYNANLSIRQKYNTTTFIEKAKKIHPNYIYTKTKYIDSDHRVEIICPSHGSFWQFAGNHLAGSGCKKCANDKKAYTQDQFIVKAKLVWGSKFSYKKSHYVNNRKSILIICPIHGIFKTSPLVHLSGSDCAKCSDDRRRKTTENFIEDAKKISSHQYLSYDKTKYINKNSKVLITCKFHGDFFQNPQDHLKGRSCPKCNRSKGEQIIEDFLKYKKIEYKAQIKFSECKDKKKLSFDFGISKNNMMVGLIEFQGRQHYQSIELFGGDAALTLYQYHDILKRTYCLQNNIPLLEIPYTQKDNIPAMLETFIEKVT